VEFAARRLAVVACPIRRGSGAAPGLTEHRSLGGPVSNWTEAMEVFDELEAERP